MSFTIPETTFSLRPMMHVLTAPYRFLAFVQNTIDEQGYDIIQKSNVLFAAPHGFARMIREGLDEQDKNFSQKTLALLRSPYTLTRIIKERIDLVEVKLPQQLAALIENNESRKRTSYEVEPRKYREVQPPYIEPPSFAKASEGKQKIIVREKEIIREIVTRTNADSNAEQRGISVNPRNDPRESASITDKLTTLRSELTDSFAKRINTLVGGFGFSTNRFDDLFVQKSLELSGKLNQPANITSSPVTFSSSITSKDISATSLSLSSTLTVSGTATSTIKGPLVAGSGNVQIIDSSGRIPALSSTYFTTLPSLFTSIGNASSTVQFSATKFQDTLSFEAAGGLLTISFDQTNKKITFSATAPTLLSVLQQGADASTFTGTTKIGGLTITSSGNLTLTGTLTISGTASSTIAGPLIAGSGNVQIIDSSGKIPAISSTYLADLSGASITSLNAGNISSGTLALARGGTGTGTAFTQGSLVFAGASGIYTQDNTNLFWDSTNKRLGIGIATPSGTLHISNASSTNALVIDSAGNVGIGTATPGSKLSVSGTIESTSGGFKFPDATTQTTAGAVVNTQVFTINGTWTKPAGAKFVEVIVVGGGGGGGGGNSGGTVVREGGSGGGGGALNRAIFNASALGATEAVTVGAATVAAAAAVDGSVGNASDFGTKLFAYGGGPGQAGLGSGNTVGGGGGGGIAGAGKIGNSTTGGNGGPPAGSTTNGGDNGGFGGANGVIDTGDGGAGTYGGGGGGADKGTDAACTENGGTSIFGGGGGGAGGSGSSAGCAGGQSGTYNTAGGGGGAGGAGGGANAGTAGTGSLGMLVSGSGGGGGGGNSGGGGSTGGAGADGGVAGGGGGGGGDGGTTGGAGGKGARGEVRVISW